MELQMISVSFLMKCSQFLRKHPMLTFGACFPLQEAMEKAIKNKVAKAVVPAIDVMFQALRFIF